jgi:hypothetical protein
MTITETPAPTTPLYEFEEIASCVEERFQRAYSPQAVGTAKSESQMTYEEVSTGYWLVIKRLGLALWIGNEKPEIQSGDHLSITIKRL